MDKIIYTEGCTCYGLNINDIDSNDIPTERKKELCLKLMNKYYTDSEWNQLLIDIAQIYGDNKFCFHCDQCGDDVYEYTIEI